jgi:hypothetical protein
LASPEAGQPFDEIAKLAVRELGRKIGRHR